MDTSSIIHYRDCILSSLDVYFMYRKEFDHENVQSWRLHLMILIDCFMKEINTNKMYEIYIEKKNNFSALIEWFVFEHFDYDFEW